MSARSSTHGRIAGASSAPHPLHEAEPARAARIAEGALRPAPSASLTLASEIARAALEAAVIVAFLLNVGIWTAFVAGRL